MTPKEFIDKVPNLILESAVNIGQVPPDQVTGTVYKILTHDGIPNVCGRAGYVYLTKGSSYTKHPHTKNAEAYRPVDSDWNIDYAHETVCRPGESHGIPPVSEDTIVHWETSLDTSAESIESIIKKKHAFAYRPHLQEQSHQI
ncbi:MAG: hypothetical protein FWC00_03760 [Firmicutes bacterium]|nr:hypothetical protein [Bacillota bacterium]